MFERAKVAIYPNAQTEQGGYTKALRNHANYPIDEPPL